MSASATAVEKLALSGPILADMHTAAAVGVLACVLTACSIAQDTDRTTSSSPGQTSPTTPRVTPAPDVDQFHAQVEKELADNPAYEDLNEQMEAEGLVDSDEFGVVAIGQTYCRAFEDGGPEGALIQLGYDIGLANDFGAILSQLRELDPTASDATASDLSDVYASAFYAADQWLCPSLGMAEATERLTDDQALAMMREGETRWIRELAYLERVEFLFEPDPASGYFGWGVELSMQQWADLGWLACDLIGLQAERSYFEVRQNVGLEALGAHSSVGADAPEVAHWALSFGVEDLCPEHLDDYDEWDGEPDGAMAETLRAALRRAATELANSPGAPSGAEPVSYESVRALHPVLDRVNEIDFFVYVLERDLLVEGSTLETLGSAYELVWATGLLPPDSTLAEIADAAAALALAVIRPNESELAALKEAKQ